MCQTYSTQRVQRNNVKLVMAQIFGKEPIHGTKAATPVPAPPATHGKNVSPPPQLSGTPKPVDGVNNVIPAASEWPHEMKRVPTWKLFAEDW